jgi:hypothetical protein
MSINPQFVVSPTASATELRLLVAGVPRPTTAWLLSGHPGADICQRWIADGVALEDHDLLLVDHATMSRLSAAEAGRLGIPPTTGLRGVVEGTGIMVRPDFVVSLRWTRASGQNVMGVTRTGAWLSEADGWRRLPETLFTLAEAVDKHRHAADPADRMDAVATLTRVLPQAALTGSADAVGLLGSVTILEADALSLDCVGDGDAMQIVPVLHHAGESATTEPLLGAVHQRAFGSQFSNWPNARTVYSLPGGVYVTIAPPLRQALEVVRRMASAPPGERRAFLREPRGALRAAIGDEADAAFMDRLVIETSAWSERVIGLGLWKKRVLPWVVLPSNPWFDGGSGADEEAKGLIVGDEQLALTPKEALALKHGVEAAIAKGKPDVVWHGGNGPVRIPADQETLRSLASLAGKRSDARDKPPEPEALLIKPNETEQEIHALVQARQAPLTVPPACLKSLLKEHQRVGLLWLQRSWKAGNPGVLLADDMGLGKTLQGLAFLAWLREGMAAGQIARRPILIVAPTGLLYNWLKEHSTHLHPPGLGDPLLAFGKGLADIRDGGERLNSAALREADWVLTTYETLRDYDRDFGAIDFAAMLMDEAQKVKTPSTRMTDAAKAMQADFRIAMTGTPVENRLSELWCIVDGVAPGHLGDLRYFSRRFEAELDAARMAARMAELKGTLEREIDHRPPLLLRRLKESELPGLPTRTDVITKAVMEGHQLAAYEAALDIGRGDRAAGRVLEALQRIRSVSLHPDSIGAEDDDALIAGSARLRVAVEALDQIASRGERALVFVESLDFMARLAGLLQRRYRLRTPPMMISGKVAGGVRQDRVDRFQDGPPGFDVMLLSPRAGGVGLTLTRANHVVHLTRWWNPAVEDQATARVLRIGQEHPVTVHVPLATLPGGRISFDENLHALLERKRQLMRDALFPAEANSDDLSSMLDATVL